jgi:hypothetical protein
MRNVIDLQTARRLRNLPAYAPVASIELIGDGPVVLFDGIAPIRLALAIVAIIETYAKENQNG